jgi:hypothetical protein
VHPQVRWIASRALCTTAASEHAVLTQVADVSAADAISAIIVSASRERSVMDIPRFNIVGVLRTPGEICEVSNRDRLVRHEHEEDIT